MMQAVILAAGESTRTRPLTETKPKPLLTVANKAILGHIVDMLEKRWIKDIVIIVGHYKEMIIDHCKKYHPQLNMKFIEQEKRNGTAGAVKLAEQHVVEDFFVLNGDIYFDETALDMLMRKYADTKSTVIAAKKSDHAELFGNLKVQEDLVQEIIEKPEKPVTSLINAGIYLFTHDIFDSINKTKMSPRDEYELTDSINIMINSGKPVRYVNFEGYYQDATYPWSMLDINTYVLGRMEGQDIRGTIEPGATIKGPVRIREGSIVKAGAYIEGPVVIGINTVIGPNCYIRPGTAIGNNCFVGNGCEIKNSIIMDNTHVSHLCYVGDSVLSEHVNFGGGTITANLRHDGENVKSDIKGRLINSERRKLGAIVGEGAKTGVHTIIYPGRKIWPRKATLPGQTVTRDII
ncbi:NTP transferase domain-containing protein [Candidatus Woesearchaeota archaeon]|nr:NTP transferase domain-containing protein [Candidatus Woesearchaeota archaeon]